MSDEKFSDKWRAGFELEVALGSLGDPRFEDLDEPMDDAEPAFCRAVADALSDLTGKKWSAPRTEPKRHGYYVVPEYGLDPILFPEGIVAGVELITPPLPLAEAEEVRADIRSALLDMEGYYNFENELETRDFGWHINLDAQGHHSLDIHHFCAAVDELSMLRFSERFGRGYTTQQRHSFGVPMLRELSLPQGADRVGEHALEFIAQRTGLGKRFAANFQRKAYVELRHYGVREFLSEVPLIQLLDGVLSAFEAGYNTISVAANRQFEKFRVLSDWLRDIRPEIGSEIGPHRKMVNSRIGQITVGGDAAGRIFWKGSASLWLLSREDFVNEPTIEHQLIADLPEAIALIALDIGENRLAGFEQTVRHPMLSDKIDQLAERLADEKLIDLDSDDWFV